MEDMNNKKTTYEVVNFSNTDDRKKTSGFGKSVIVPFFSGIVGTSLVIGTCFGVPTVREKLIGNTSIETVNTRNFKFI